MALTPQQLSDLNARIGWLLDKHLAPIFKPGVQLTFIARTPGNDEADVLVTTERDINNVVALALRSLGRAEVGDGIDTVPRTCGVNPSQAPDQSEFLAWARSTHKLVPVGVRPACCDHGKTEDCCAGGCAHDEELERANKSWKDAAAGVDVPLKGQ